MYLLNSTNHYVLCNYPINNNIPTKVIYNIRIYIYITLSYLLLEHSLPAPTILPLKLDQVIHL